jgi:predicted DCC family thiol-disulfide oxidoreductase YuxK
MDSENTLVVIFDGHCGLCNRVVRWLLVRDRRNRLRFAAFDSPKVAGLLARHELDAADAAFTPNTIVVVCDPGGPLERLSSRSDAVLILLRELSRPWPAVAAALGWIPRPLRDLGYRLIARWRYRIWGRLETCPLPTSEERARFL